MIANHSDFLDAIRGHKIVRIVFYSIPDHGLVDRECAPLNYAPAPDDTDPCNRYWVWDWACTAGANPLRLLPEQITSLVMLGNDFDPASIPETVAPDPTAGAGIPVPPAKEAPPIES